MKESEIRRRQELQKQYHIICILDITWDFWSPRCIPSSPSPAALDNHEETFQFRAAAEQYCPSPFTSNSEGLFGKICFRTDAEWRRVYVKKALHVIDELRALPDVLWYFPASCVQQFLAADESASQLFFRRFEGKMLSKVRLDYYDNKSFLNHIGPMDAVDWFVEIEMQRTEHVGDAYRSTMNMDPILARCEEQRIHRFYYTRLESDSRFLEFYSEQCLDILGIYDLKEVRTSDFLNMPLTLNGTSYPPLRYYLDRAKDVLDPSAPGGLSCLPVAFGLGDGHGGHVMVTEEYASLRMIYLDYEVSGFHCPFLDIAKSISNDGFFNGLYADLLCDDATDRQNKSGAVVSWVINSKALCIDYNVMVDAIGKITPGYFTNYFSFPYPTTKHFSMSPTYMDFEKCRAIIIDDGRYEISLTTVQDMAIVVAEALGYEGEWPTTGGFEGSRMTMAELLHLGERLRGPFTLEVVNLEHLRAGKLECSWVPILNHPTIPLEEVQEMSKVVTLMLLQGVASAGWCVSDEWNKLLPNLQLETAEQHLTRVWKDKP